MPHDAVLAHQSFDPLVVDLAALAAQLRGHPRRPVGAVGVGVDVDDLIDQMRLVPLQIRRPDRGVAPVVVG